jgi:hypothetical protein
MPVAVAGAKGAGGILRRRAIRPKTLGEEIRERRLDLNLRQIDLARSTR